MFFSLEKEVQNVFKLIFPIWTPFSKFQTKEQTYFRSSPRQCNCHLGEIPRFTLDYLGLIALSNACN